MIIINSQGAMCFSTLPGVQQVVAPRTSMEELERIMGAGDCFLLLEGGADVEPQLYGEKNMYSHCNPVRDRYESRLWSMARRSGVPILGICRGHQLMAVLEQGTLYQDLYKQTGGHHAGTHDVRFTDAATECGFIDLMQSNPNGRPHVVNSMHHQAVRDVPKNAKVLATGPNDINEALLYPYGLSVQWHPEFLGHTEFVEYMRRFMK